MGIICLQEGKLKMSSTAKMQPCKKQIFVI